MAHADLARLTAIVTTSGRKKSFQRLVRSVRRYYPQLRVVVADDSRDEIACQGVDCLRLPPRAGQSTARNALLARIRTPYFLLLNDRCEISKETQIEYLLELVAEDKLDLAAGNLTGCERRFWFFVRRRPQPGHGIFELAGDHLTLHRGHRTVGEGYSWCDIVPDFYVARTDKVRAMGGWDPELGSDEREEFFVRGHRHGLRVGISPEVTAWQWNEPNLSEESEGVRSLKSLATAKMGLTRMTDFEGRVFKAPRRTAAA